MVIRLIMVIILKCIEIPNHYVIQHCAILVYARN